VTNGTLLSASNAVCIGSVEIICDIIFVREKVLDSTDFWDVMPFRWLTVFQENLVPLSLEQKKTVAIFSTGM
jgi:hypothetical protein